MVDFSFTLLDVLAADSFTSLLTSSIFVVMEYVCCNISLRFAPISTQ